MFSGFSGSSLFSQGIDIGSRNSNRLFIGINLSPTKSAFDNVLYTQSITPETNPKKSSFFSLEAGYFMTRNLGISTGIGYKTFSIEYALASYNASVSAIDADNDPYERRISGKDILEKQDISMLCIPILLNFRIPFNQKAGFRLQSGLNISIPASKKFSSSGTFSYSGYYEKYKILITDVPFENFTSNITADSDGDLELSSMIPELNLSGGLYFRFQNKIELSAGFLYSKILSNISAYKSSNDFILSKNPDELFSLMNFSKKLTAQATGFSVGVRYYIK